MQKNSVPRVIILSCMLGLIVTQIATVDASSLQDIIDGIQRQETGRGIWSDAQFGQDVPPAPASVQTKPVIFNVEESQLAQTAQKALFAIGKGLNLENFEQLGWGVVISEQGHLITSSSILSQSRQLVALSSELQLFETTIVTENSDTPLVVLQINPSDPTPYFSTISSLDLRHWEHLKYLDVSYQPSVAQTRRGVVPTPNPKQDFRITASNFLISDQPIDATQVALFNEPIKIEVEINQPSQDAPVFSTNGALIGIFVTQKNSVDDSITESYGTLFPVASFKKSLPAPSDNGAKKLKVPVTPQELERSAQQAIVSLANYTQYEGWQIGRFATGLIVNERGTIVAPMHILTNEVWGWLFDVIDHQTDIERRPAPSLVDAIKDAFDPQPAPDTIDIQDAPAEVTADDMPPAASQQPIVQGWTHTQAQQHLSPVRGLANAPVAIAQREEFVPLRRVLRCGPYPSQREAAAAISALRERGYHLTRNPEWTAIQVPVGRILVKTADGKVVTGTAGLFRPEPFSLGYVTIHAHQQDLRYLPLTTNATVLRGDSVVAMGIPHLNIDVRTRRGFTPEQYFHDLYIKPTAVTGTVTNPAIDLAMAQGLASRTPSVGVQIDALTNAGWRGGPMLNSYGEVIAIINQGDPDEATQVTGIATRNLLEQFQLLGTHASTN